MTELNIDFKKELKAYCKAIIVDKVKSLEQAMESAQQSANSETRSTAGDKHDTARAMMHLEKEKMGAQLSQNLQLLRVFDEIKETDEATVGTGKMVETNVGVYYFCVSLGQVPFKGNTIFVISPQSPIGKAFFGKKIGEKVIFNGRSFTIKTII